MEKKSVDIDWKVIPLDAREKKLSGTGKRGLWGLFWGLVFWGSFYKTAWDLKFSVLFFLAHLRTYDLAPPVGM